MQTKQKTCLFAAIIVIVAAYLLFNASFSRNGQLAAPENLDKVFNVISISVTYYNFTALKPPAIINYSAYAAITQSQQELGYMNQTSLGTCNNSPNCIGMVFIFPSHSAPCFWMENTRIPLKQIWIADNGSVDYVYNATPYSTKVVCAQGSTVLETLPNSTIAMGDKIKLG